MIIYESYLLTETALPFVIGGIIGVFTILAGFFTTKSFRYSKQLAMLGIVLELGCLFVGMHFFRVPVGYLYVAWTDPAVITSEQIAEKYTVLTDRGNNTYELLEIEDSEKRERYMDILQSSSVKRRYKRNAPHE